MSNLLNRVFPPGGYKFYQPEINWPAPGYDFMKSPEMIAQDLSRARAANPWSGLDPTLEACIDDIVEYTCKRYPKLCGPAPSGATLIEGTPTKPKKGCCGGRGR